MIPVTNRGLKLELGTHYLKYASTLLHDILWGKVTWNLRFLFMRCAGVRITGNTLNNRPVIQNVPSSNTSNKKYFELFMIRLSSLTKAAPWSDYFLKLSCLKYRNQCWVNVFITMIDTYYWAKRLNWQSTKIFKPGFFLFLRPRMFSLKPFLLTSKILNAIDNMS